MTFNITAGATVAGDSKVLNDGGKQIRLPTTAINDGIAATRYDMMLDMEYISAISGVTQSINKPTRYGSNPVFPVDAETDGWDVDKYYGSVALVGGTWHLWYGGLNNPLTIQVCCYATSSDGITWTKPNLGLVSWGGNTNNNIYLDHPSYNPGVYYDVDGAADRIYVSSIETKTGEDTDDIHIYIGSDETTWSFLITLSTSFTNGTETKNIIKRDDDTWILYYKYKDASNIRHIAAMHSLTSNLGGSWIDMGPIIDPVSANSQPYTMAAFRHNEHYFGFVMDYNDGASTADIDLYTSRDGLSWRLVDTGWLPLGAGAEWDDSSLVGCSSLIKVSNDWRFYYNGWPLGHSSYPRDSRFGYATVGYERIGQMTATGTITAKPLRPADGAALNVNVDASGGGKLEIEILDGKGDTIGGYAQTDSTDITTDTFSTEATWGSATLPTGTEIVIKFHLTNATLYSYEVV